MGARKSRGAPEAGQNPSANTFDPDVLRDFKVIVRGSIPKDAKYDELFEAMGAVINDPVLRARIIEAARNEYINLLQQHMAQAKPSKVIDFASRRMAILQRREEGARWRWWDSSAGWPP